jgi:hypothetical protein
MGGGCGEGATGLIVGASGEGEEEDAAGWKPDMSGQGGEHYAPGQSMTSQLERQSKLQKYANDPTYSTGSTSSPSTAEKRMANQDELPSIEDINAKNKTFWPTPKASESVTSGTPEPPPGNKSTGTGENYLPGGKDIDMAARLSRTSRLLDRGKTWGTSDAALRMAEYYKAQDAKANALIGAINSKNAAFYARRG